jgi:dihydrolipoamide dehydrogenase
MAYDLVVIGGGPAGYVAAIRAAQLGMTVACVEKEPSLGGTCLRVGCIPSKALLESSERYAEAREGLKEHGVIVGAPVLDLAAMMKRKDRIVRGLSGGIDLLFRKWRVVRIPGAGRIEGPGRVSVEGVSGTTGVEGRNILIATGSLPATLQGVEVDGDRIGTSTEALSWDRVPGHLVVIGAGFIGLELGSVWSRLGARVTVLEFLDRILPGTDAEVADHARKAMKRQGITFRLGTRVQSARRDGDGCVVDLEGGDPLRCDRVLLAVGRVPCTHGIGLETVGVNPDPRGRIPVDPAFRTSADGVYAVGDVIRGPMLAHKAHEEGVACVEMMVTGKGHVDYDTVPGVAYTRPEVATVGRTEEDLVQAGIAFRKGMFPFRANGRANARGDTDGFVKVLADATTDRILGVHIVGPSAGDMIAEAAVAMALGATSEAVARACHAHPTLPEAVKEACLAVTGRAIHV